MRFSKEMKVEEALRLHPRASEVFEAFGLPCIRCVVSERETITEAARLNGLDADAIVEELNRLPKGTEKEVGEDRQEVGKQRA